MAQSKREACAVCGRQPAFVPQKGAYGLFRCAWHATGMSHLVEVPSSWAKKPEAGRLWDAAMRAIREREQALRDAVQ